MKNVLVLEDDENLRELLVDVLDSLDYKVEGASAPEVALHLAHEIAFDVVISDVRMAGPVDGLGALEELKRQRPQLRCIVMTGFADELAPVRALQISVDDYLYKPFEVKDVLAALERLKKSAQQNAWYRKALSRLMGQPDPAQSLNQLQMEREACLLDFFVAVRSSFLYAETALDAWDRLEDLELAYLQAMRTPASVTAQTAQSASDRYRTWRSQLSQRAAKQELVMAAQRSADKVERTVFRRFLERIKTGDLSAAELGMSVSLRRMPEERRLQDSEYQHLWQRMWA
ncbi:response regulator [bacterium]|nr:response regulator [bacterium]